MEAQAASPAKRKPGPVPGARAAKRAAQAQPVVEAKQVESFPLPAQPAPHVEPVAQAPAPARTDPLQRHRNIQTMPEAELRVYARQVGVSKRDAEELAVDRLRVNCVHMVNAIIEEL